MMLCSSSRHINQFQPVQQSRQKALRAYCPNIYTLKPGQRAKAEEKELKNEIIELEKTFENLDLDNSIGGGGSITSTHRKPFTRGLYR